MTDIITQLKIRMQEEQTRSDGFVNLGISSLQKLIDRVDKVEKALVDTLDKQPSVAAKNAVLYLLGIKDEDVQEAEANLSVAQIEILNLKKQIYVLKNCDGGPGNCGACIPCLEFVVEHYHNRIGKAEQLIKDAPKPRLEITDYTNDNDSPRPCYNYSDREYGRWYDSEAVKKIREAK